MLCVIGHLYQAFVPAGLNNLLDLFLCLWFCPAHTNTNLCGFVKQHTGLYSMVAFPVMLMLCTSPAYALR